MRMLESDAKSVLMNDADTGTGSNFNAFNIVDESIDNFKCYLNFSQSEQP